MNAPCAHELLEVRLLDSSVAELAVVVHQDPTSLALTWKLQPQPCPGVVSLAPTPRPLARCLLLLLWVKSMTVAPGTPQVRLVPR